MFERFGRGIEGETFSDLIDRSWEMDSEFSYGENAPVEEYIGLLMDLFGATERLQKDVYGVINSVDGDAVLHLMDEPYIARKLFDGEYLTELRERNNDYGSDSEFLESYDRAMSLSKKKMIELIPQVCGIMEKFMVTRGAHECVDELMKEVHEQNERLVKTMGV